MTKENKRENQTTNRMLYLDLSYLGFLIFLIFRIPISNMIGNEGNGYFSVTWELYAIFGLLFGHSLYHITKEMIRKRIRKKQYKSSARVLKVSFLAAFVLSVVGGILIYTMADSLLSRLGMKLSAISFRFMGALLVFNSLSGVLGGYFEGNGTKIPSCFSKIVESLIAGTGALLFTSMLYGYGSKVGDLLFNSQYQPAFGAAGITAGYICGSVLAFVFLMIVNVIYQRPLKMRLQTEESGALESFAPMILDYLKIACITVLEVAFFVLYRMVNMGMYIKAYSNTESQGKIVQYLGSYHGKILVITGILILMILSVTGKNIKKIQKSYYKDKMNYGWNYFMNDMKQLAVLAVPGIAVVAVLAQNLLTFLYKSTGNTEVVMLQIASVNILLIPLAVYLYKLMIELDFKLINVISPAVAFGIQTAVMAVVVKKENIGAWSLVIAEVTFWAVIVIIELAVMIKTFKGISFNGLSLKDISFKRRNE